MKINYKKIIAIVPAYNEERSISKVIRGIRKVSNKINIIVINDGSTDNTILKIKSLKEKLIDIPLNLGIGGAVQTGLMYAKKHNLDVAIQVDADGQHNPEEIPKLLLALKDTDLVIGSRFLKKTKYQSTFLRFLGNKIFSFLILVTCNKKITDSTSGYRVFSRRAIDFFSSRYPSDFPEPCSIVAFLKNGYKIREVAVEMKKRQGGVSSVTPFKAVYLMLSISTSILFESMKGEKTIYE